MREKDTWNFVKAGLVIAVVLFFVTPVTNVFANVGTLDDHVGNANGSEYIMKVENTTAFQGDTNHVIRIFGKWNTSIAAYTIAMHYDSSIMEISDVKVGGIGIPPFWWGWNYNDDATPSYVRAFAMWEPPGIPPGEGTLFAIWVNISDDAPPGNYTLDLFNDYQAIPSIESTYVDNDANGHDPDLIEGTLTILLVWICGDVNDDGEVSIADVVYLINYLFNGGPEPQPLVCVGDVNGDEQVTISDGVYLTNYLFRGGDPPVENCCG